MRYSLERIRRTGAFGEALLRREGRDQTSADRQGPVHWTFATHSRVSTSSGPIWRLGSRWAGTVQLMAKRRLGRLLKVSVAEIGPFTTWPKVRELNCPSQVVMVKSTAVCVAHSAPSTELSLWP